MTAKGNLRALAGLVLAGACALLWSQQTFTCGGICPITIGSGSCMPTLQTAGEDDTCLTGWSDSSDLSHTTPLCKSVNYVFTWADDQHDSLLAQGAGQSRWYYDGCTDCTYYDPHAVSCWPLFDNPVETDGEFYVVTRDQYCLAQTFPWCEYCGSQAPKALDCQTQSGFVWPRYHTCTCD